MSHSSSGLQRETEFFVSQILAVAPSVSKAVPKVLQAIGKNLGWVAGNFWKLDADLHKIRCDQMWVSPSVKVPNFLPCVDLSGLELPAKVWKSRKSHWVKDLKGNLKSAVAFPICLGKKMLGVMEFFNKKNKKLDKNLLQTFDAIGAQVSQFIERKEVEARLQVAYDEMEIRVQERTADLQVEIIERKRVEKEILEVTLKEQRRFGSQLHDGLCQDLAGILMFIKSLTQKMSREKPLDIADLEKVADLLDGAVSQARETARGLYPGELEGTSLIYMLEELASRQNSSDVSCRFHCPEAILINENDIATHFYKIAQEGISNAVKHGKAKMIEVSFVRNNGNIVLTIKDDGVGFVGDPQNSKGIGLKIMKNRGHIIGASFQVEPNVPNGVILTCSLKGAS